jgi:small subunit ribosomal protein S15
MTLTPAKTSELAKKFGANDKDSGSASVQVALLTERINYLSSHFEKNKHDHHSNRGLLKITGRRKSLLKYIQRTDEPKYAKVIKELNLRK